MTALIAWALKIEAPEVLLALPVVIGAIPAVVTYLVERQWKKSA